MGILSIALKERSKNGLCRIAIAFDRMVMIFFFMEFVFFALFALQLHHCNIQRVHQQKYELPLCIYS
jgi:hypothetical protein